MDFTALKTEFAARGFNHLSSTRQGQYVNRARARLDNRYRWPYREASGEGTAPVTVADLGQVEVVMNETQDYPLEHASYEDLVHMFHDLTTTGNPVYWYRAYSSGSPIVATYPTNSDTIGVQYWKRCADLSAGSDEPLSPDDYHMLIVDMAVQLAYRDADNHPAAEAMQAEVDRQLAEMVDDLMAQQAPRYLKVDFWNSEDW